MNSIKLSGSRLKIIATICMFIDHFYKFGILPYNILFVILGRMAFPLFAFCVAEGIYYTRNRARYLITMILFAIISELPFDLMVFGHFDMRGQNIMWTFAFAIGAICAADYLKEKIGPNGKLGYLWHCLFLILFGFVSVVYATDYHIAGVFCVVTLYVLKKWANKIDRSDSSWKASVCLCVIASNLILFTIGSGASQLYAVLACIPIWFYDGTRGCKNKYLGKAFYVAYPLHMFLIYFITAYQTMPL